MEGSVVTPPPRRVVHLDLKGLPPTPARLLSLLDVFVAAGFNAVLVEWEDTFPWRVNPSFSSASAYSAETVRLFVERAEALSIELIPLVQCLSHMETPLGAIRSPELREQPERCDVLNVLAPGARPLIEGMIDDVLSLMPNVRHFHLGGDEAWTFGRHPDTRRYAEEHGKARLYLQHVEPIAARLAAGNVRPLLWHDMMLGWDDAALRDLSEKADLVVWGYVGHPDTVEHHFSTRFIERFVRAGLKVWGAGAFKGADGINVDLPDVDARLFNAAAWLELHGRYGFHGLIATGWSRYSTHRLQTAPTDGALDALVRVGRLWRDGAPLDAQGATRVLAGIGEAERADRCRSALSRLGTKRRAAWREVQVLEEMCALAAGDPARRGSAVLAFHWQALRRCVEQLEAASSEVHDSLVEAVMGPALAEYVESRIAPLRAALNRLAGRLHLDLETGPYPPSQHFGETALDAYLLG